MLKEQHPFTAKIKDKNTKILVRMPDKRLRWRRPQWRLGSWYVRDSHGWRELIAATPGGFEAGTM